ncbi:hypothetical protein Tco_0427408 [Tanacetum coccineum]
MRAREHKAVPRDGQGHGRHGLGTKVWEGMSCHNEAYDAALDDGRRVKIGVLLFELVFTLPRELRTSLGWSLGSVLDRVFELLQLQSNKQVNDTSDHKVLQMVRQLMLLDSCWYLENSNQWPMVNPTLSKVIAQARNNPRDFELVPSRFGPVCLWMVTQTHIHISTPKLSEVTSKIGCESRVNIAND